MSRRCTRQPPGAPRCKWKGPEGSFRIVDFHDGHGDRYYCSACFTELMELLGNATPHTIENLATGEVKHVQSETSTIN
jgi:hypothetical protein